jgi:uncharacterized membrane protein (GlpM family)
LDPFYLKLLVSFVVGGLWIMAVSVIAERFGTKIGGFIGGIPSTSILAIFFIWWTQGSEQVYQGTIVFPLAFSINSAFFIVYALLSLRGIKLGLTSAILTWLILQALLFKIGVDSFLFSLIFFLIALGTSYLYLVRGLGIESCGGVKVRYNPWQLLWRAVFAGLMISIAVVMSQIGGPVLGGIFSTFPANNISTLFITSKSINIDFSRAIIPPLMISAGINCVVLITSLRYASQVMAFLPAFLLACGVSALSGLFVYRVLIPRMT